VLNHGALFKPEGKKLTIELNESYAYQQEVLGMVSRIRNEVRLARLRKLNGVQKTAAAMLEEKGSQNDTVSLNQSVLFKVADYIGIMDIYYSINDKLEWFVDSCKPCYSNVFPAATEVQLIQDLR
jgi:hypothetical protein